MIKAVLFDFGGVLTEGGRAGGIQQTIATLCNRRPEEIVIDDLHQRFVRGQMEPTEYFAELNRRYPCAQPMTPDAFISESNIYTRSAPVYALAEQLREHNIATGILSNMYPMSAKKLRREGFYDGFEPVIISGNEHFAKPDPEFFQLALDRLGLPATEVLFIDDHEGFRQPSEALGFHFIMAVSPEQIVADTKALIARENGLTL